MNRLSLNGPDNDLQPQHHALHACLDGVQGKTFVRGPTFVRKSDLCPRSTLFSSSIPVQCTRWHWAPHSQAAAEGVMAQTKDLSIDVSNKSSESV